MAKITANQSFDLTAFFAGEATLNGETRFTIEGSGTRAFFNGTYKLAGGGIQSGVVNSVKLYSVSETGKTTVVASISGLSADAAVAWDLADLQSGEELFQLVLDAGDTFAGSSGADAFSGFGGNDSLQGNNGADVLDGGDGNDTLRGGVGRDTLFGGSGDDTFYVDRTLEQVLESGGGGYDRVFSPVSFSLSDSVEELVLQGSAAIDGGGNAEDNLLSGNSAVNRLSGEEGNDTLAGGGGADVLAGGEGDDEYRLDGADTLLERADEGTDLVSTATSHTLQAYFENLVLTGSAAVNGTGNDLDNALTGNAAANALRGNDGADTLDGGAGADTLQGGTGDDLYRLSDVGDTIEEVIDGGLDRVEATVSVTLGAEVENLVLQGKADLNGAGNALANTISGNDARNVLSGADGNDALVGNGGADTLDGGAGDDQMLGGRGGDTYILDSLGDAVSEEADEGRDTVSSSVDHSLGDNFENLALTGGANLEGAGNELPNQITGNSGSNLLEGASGTDTLSGGGGADTLDGGTGADQMSGGGGNDLYFVDDLGDSATESASGGFDIVRSVVDHQLSPNIEQLLLEGSDPIEGTGNDLSNLIGGNESDNALNGQGGNDTLDGGEGADAMRGGAGDDLFLVDDAGDTATESSGEGNDRVEASVSFTLSAHVERLVLLGEEDLDGAGSAQANTITGTIGNNALDGGAGADTLTGGEGDDTYTVDNANDTVVELADEGTDTVRASIGFSLADNLENLTLLGSVGLNGMGNAIDNLIRGNSGGNLLEGGEGADTLEGGEGSDTLSGGLGLDVLVGGAGDDTFEVDATQVDDEVLTDKVVETADGGLDTVQSLISYTLGANVEVLNLGGSSAIDGTGNDTANTIVGNFAVNVLAGGAGNDTLSAGFGDDQLDGGTGDDSMSGGLGNDLYVVDSVLDAVNESASQGTDTVRASVQVSLAANVENLILVGSLNLDAVGDAQDNTLGSNLGNNLIDGGGGTDTVSYADIEARITVDLSKSGAQDTKGAGLDTLLNIENATGGKGDDFLTGSSIDNVLDGSAGADTLVGGQGNDTLIVDNEEDVATDWQNAGTDTVRSSVNWKLDPAIENLTLTGTEDVFGWGNLVNTAGSGNNIITGNVGNNVLMGYNPEQQHLADDPDGAFKKGDLIGPKGDGADTLNGAAGDDTIFGGDGNDSLTGGAGRDTFVFNAAPAAGNVDQIADFDVTDDVIALQAAVFEGLSVEESGWFGHWASENFRVGGATDANDYILYDSATGALYYDADASGAGAAVRFATLASGLQLSDANFRVYTDDADLIGG